jgi:hypothetical protein
VVACCDDLTCDIYICAKCEQADSFPKQVPVDEGDERKARDLCSRHVPIRFYSLQDEEFMRARIVGLIRTVRSERDAELPSWKDKPDVEGWWFDAIKRAWSNVALRHLKYDTLDESRWFGPIVITPDGGRKA